MWPLYGRLYDREKTEQTQLPANMPGSDHRPRLSRTAALNTLLEGKPVLCFPLPCVISWLLFFLTARDQSALTQAGEAYCQAVMGRRSPPGQPKGRGGPGSI